MDTKGDIAIIGLGYVGLPLAVEFGKYRKVIGFDLDKDRIIELKQSIDRTLETTPDEISSSHYLEFTHNQESLSGASIYIISVPTPVDENKLPDTKALESASETVATYLNKGDIVIYESTVYPGCTEEVCVPVLEKFSGLKFNKDFFCGYSPERINPGDKQHRLVDIVKVTSGSNSETASIVDSLYSEIINAGTYRASSIKVAEAAKVIENTQRDVNIALMNELSQIFSLLDIDTKEVIDAASTKWNFLGFTPGLVGGHCIGVDPYYLTYKAKQIGYTPKMILSGREINDSVGKFVVNKLCSLLEQRNVNPVSGEVLVLGIAFKENCPDIRNTKVVEIINELNLRDINVDIYDPIVDTKEVQKEYGIDCIQEINPTKKYNAVVIAVGHDDFLDIDPQDFRDMTINQGIIFDLKSILSKEHSDLRL